MSGVAILIPAAGASTRMRGRDKLLEDVDGIPLLARQVEIAHACNQPVLVTLPKDNPNRGAMLSTYSDVETRVIPDASSGLSASIRMGAAWASRLQATGLMILLADLPELTSDDLRKLIQSFDKKTDGTLRAADESGAPGHPVIIPARLFPDLMQLSGDHGASALLKNEVVTPVPLAGQRATTDLDTPEAWAAWRRKQDV